MDKEKELEFYNKVNLCKTHEELAEVIESLADKNGMIQGRTSKFISENMANFCRNFNAIYKSGQINLLTRNFGIRQQALMIHYYNNE